jgi:hypothetical protein
MRKVFYIFFLLQICSVYVPAQSASPENPAVVFTYTCFQNTDKTWGYDVRRSQKIFIHQPTIPAVLGLKGFIDKQSASSVAQLAIKKLRERPEDFPTITIQDLQKLKII